MKLLNHDTLGILQKTFMAHVMSIFFKTCVIVFSSNSIDKHVFVIFIFNEKWV